MIPQKLKSLSLNKKAQFISVDEKIYSGSQYLKNDYFTSILQLYYCSLNDVVYTTFINEIVKKFESEENLYKRAINLIKKDKKTEEIFLNRIKYEELKKIRITRRDTIKFLESDIAYVNLDLLQMNRIQQMFDKIEDNKAVIFDMRGYPNHIIWKLAPHLTDDKEILDSQFATPIFNIPFEAQISEYRLQQAYTSGVGKRITTPIVILMNEKTQSLAEYTCLIIKELTNATLIGRQTAGSDGNITFLELPGNILTGFTGMDPQDARGNSRQGIGLIPDIVVNRTLEGIKTGKDEALEKAIEFLKERIDF